MQPLSQWVNPHIGTIAHLLKSTKPEVMLPHSYPKSCPIYDENQDYYSNEVVKGLPMGMTVILPGEGAARQPSDFHYRIDRSREAVHPYGSALEFDDTDIIVYATVSSHAYAYKFENAARLMISAPDGSAISVKGTEIHVHARGDLKQRRFENEYLIITANQPFSTSVNEKNFMIIEFDAKEIEFFGSLSFISFEKAKEIFQKEVSGRSFSQIQDSAKQIWDELLAKVKVSDNTEHIDIRADQYKAFYTALYRSFQRMVNYGEYGQYFSNYDGKVHEGEFFYTNDNLWDTYRSMHPLQLLLDPKRQEDLLESYNLMYKHSGLMPSTASEFGERPVMLGFHAAPMFADALAKGLKCDYESAYEGIRKNAMEQSMLPWVCNTTATVLDKCYHEKGFFPALKPDEDETVPETHPFEKRQSVAVTLEHCYDDWCAAQIAKKLGKKDDYNMFMKRAENYKNLYRADIGFMSPKDINGNWIEYDPMWGGGQGGRDYYAENNAYIYNWHVQHDFKGLMELMGGPKAAEKKLDELFTIGPVENGRLSDKFPFLYRYPDATGLIGMFCMGNEPSFHIPYLYNLCGAPWKTQKRMRDLMDIWFTNSPTGICGDEDGGAMSSFFVFSAMGFYPMCPGSPEYLIGTPLFDHIEIDAGEGRGFVIKAEGASKGLRYIQSAALNGKNHNTPVLLHEDIVAGGELVFTMGRRPNKEWGI